MYNIKLNIEWLKKKKELAKLEQDKMKEFNEAAAKVFAKVENINELSKEYYSSLNEATGK